jgi:ornithine cyclodeaminase/alanine dehydrogenase
MGKFYLVNGTQVRASLNMADVIPEIEKVYRLKSAGKCGVFPVVTHEWIKGTKDMDIKSGYIDDLVSIYGLKALTYIESNSEQGLDCLTGTMMVFDSQTGQLKGILDSAGITGYRTGAAGAIGSKYLARPDSQTLLIIGAGNQAFYNLAGNLMVMKRIKRVFVCNPTGLQRAAGFASGIKERLERDIFAPQKEPDIAARLDFNCEAVALEDLGKAAEQADIIVTTTPARSPILKKEWIREGVHINCIGADMEGKEEIDKEIFAKARVIVDDIVQATTIGETEIPVKEGIIRKEDIIGEIGGVIEGKVKGRISEKDITIFDSTGLALQDLITAEFILRKAEASGLPQYEL